MEVITGKYSKEKKSKERKRPMQEIVLDLLHENPNIFKRYKHVKDKGVYVCNNETNVWKIESNLLVEKHLITLLETTLDLQPSEIYDIKTRPYIEHLRKFFCSEIIDDNFPERLDKNLNLFVFNNKIFDFSKPERIVIRDICLEDYVSETCGYDFDVDKAVIHSSDVKDFFEQVLPDEREREVFLTTCANYLVGKREEKNFVIMTDRRSGNNGKTATLNLLFEAFGNYAHSGEKYILRNPSGADGNSHEGDMLSLKGKRLLVCEELKKFNELDTGFLEKLTAGKLSVTERQKNSSNSFKYILKSGIILSFTENDYPKFDVSDSAFINRMVVCPFRSKFVEKDEKLVEEHTFEMNPKIERNFENWRCAVIHHLRKFFGRDVRIPESMRKWKVTICQETNEYLYWIQENLIVTGEKAHFVSVSSIYIEMKKSVRLNNMNEIVGVLKNWARESNVDYKEMHNYLEGKEKKFKRRVFLGIKFKKCNDFHH